jgi:gentisate 1,2-dioxygenase
MDSPQEGFVQIDEVNNKASFLDKLPAQHLEPLWTKMDVMVPGLPGPSTKPHIWKYADNLPLLLKAGEMVPAEQAERRVLMLVNPNSRMCT